MRNLSTGTEASATGESLNSGDVAVHPAARHRPEARLLMREARHPTNAIVVMCGLHSVQLRTPRRRSERSIIPNAVFEGQISRCCWQLERRSRLAFSGRCGENSFSLGDATGSESRLLAHVQCCLRGISYFAGLTQ